MFDVLFPLWGWDVSTINPTILGRVWILRASHFTIFTPLERSSFFVPKKIIQEPYLQSFWWWLVWIHPLVTTNFTTNPNWQNNGISQENSPMITCHPNKTNRNMQQHHPQQHHNTASKGGARLPVINRLVSSNPSCSYKFVFGPFILLMAQISGDHQSIWYYMFHSFQGFLSYIPGGWPLDFRTINCRGFSLGQWTLK